MRHSRFIEMGVFGKKECTGVSQELFHRDQNPVPLKVNRHDAQAGATPIQSSSIGVTC